MLGLILDVQKPVSGLLASEDIANWVLSAGLVIAGGRTFLIPMFEPVPLSPCTVDHQVVQCNFGSCW